MPIFRWLCVCYTICTHTYMCVLYYNAHIHTKVLLLYHATPAHNIMYTHTCTCMYIHTSDICHASHLCTHVHIQTCMCHAVLLVQEIVSVLRHMCTYVLTMCHSCTTVVCMRTQVHIHTYMCHVMLLVYTFVHVSSHATYLCTHVQAKKWSYHVCHAVALKYMTVTCATNMHMKNTSHQANAYHVNRRSRDQQLCMSYHTQRAHVFKLT